MKKKLISFFIGILLTLPILTFGPGAQAAEAYTLSNCKLYYKDFNFDGWAEPWYLCYTDYNWAEEFFGRKHDGNYWYKPVWYA